MATFNNPATWIFKSLVVQWLKYPNVTAHVTETALYIAANLPVFNHFFNGVGRTLNNFSRSNAVDNSLVEPPDNSRHVYRAADF